MTSLCIPGSGIQTGHSPVVTLPTTATANSERTSGTLCHERLGASCRCGCQASSARFAQDFQHDPPEAPGSDTRLRSAHVTNRLEDQTSS